MEQSVVVWGTARCARLFACLSVQICCVYDMTYVSHCGKSVGDRRVASVSQNADAELKACTLRRNINAVRSIIIVIIVSCSSSS